MGGGFRKVAGQSRGKRKGPHPEFLTSHHMNFLKRKLQVMDNEQGIEVEGRFTDRGGFYKLYLFV